MSNARILIISLGVIAASFIALTVLPMPGNRLSLQNRNQNLANEITPAPQGSEISSEPKVMTFTQLYSTLTSEEKTCVTNQLKSNRISILQKGNEAVTDPELKILNKCVNPLIP